MAGPIPEAWRRAVVRILRTNDPRVIKWTRPALQRWDADTFGDGQKFEAYDAMITALEDANATGNETTSYPGQSGTFEFFFSFRSKTMYGKIALNQDDLQVLILSAHKPTKPTL